MIVEAKNLSPDQKAVIENLLGRRVLHTETISLRSIKAAPMPDEARHKLANELQAYFAKLDARRQPATEAEEEEILNEAMRSVRPGYRPHK